MKWILSAQARLDLLEIWNYIAEDSVEAADRMTDKLINTFDLLARSPQIGHFHHDLTSAEVLFWPVGAYIIVYRRRKDVLEIAAVTRGSRDIPTLLRGR